jgi:hypothetical protein
LDSFASAYEAMNRWRSLGDGTELLIVGTDNAPFPIPLKKNDSGNWYFDADAGKQEILARRVGQDELVAIDVCGALVDAQNEYFSQPHDGDQKQYALKFISDKGKQDGLHWEGSRSPLGPLVAFATSESDMQSSAHQPFYGYYFRLLTKQGSHAEGGAKDYVVNGKMVNGFAFVAYPSEYENSGVMTFMVNQQGVVYQKDLGKNTSDQAAAITEFDPGDGWSLLED